MKTLNKLCINKLFNGRHSLMMFLGVCKAHIPQSNVKTRSSHESASVARASAWLFFVWPLSTTHLKFVFGS